MITLASPSDFQRKRYKYLRDKAPRLVAWRTYPRTRALIISYFVALGSAITVWAMYLFNVIQAYAYLYVYVGALLVSMVAFAMLRCTIDAKDIAPDDELDDYELEVLKSWRSQSHVIFEQALLLGGMLFIVLEWHFSDNFAPGCLTISAGLYMLFTYLVVGTLPAVGFAKAFNNNANDTYEELY